ncbi:unnamed protein product [Cochlearia groenlandica]
MTSSSSRKLQVSSPVPADIDIANSVEPLHISEIAKDLNLTPIHYDLYGKYKAKAKLWRHLFSCWTTIISKVIEPNNKHKIA